MKLFNRSEQGGNKEQPPKEDVNGAEKEPVKGTWFDKATSIFSIGKRAGEPQMKKLTEIAKDDPDLADLARQGGAAIVQKNAEIDNLAKKAEKEIQALKGVPSRVGNRKRSHSSAGANMELRRREEAQREFSKKDNLKGRNGNSTQKQEKKNGRPRIGVMEGIERMNKYIAKTTAELRNTENIPIDNNWRISREEFLNEGIIDKNEYNLHSKYIQDRENQFMVSRPKPEDIDFGEEMEKFVTVLFHKFFGEEYVVARTNRYDDIKGGIDNVFMNRQTGEVIGAFDAVVGKNKKARMESKSSKTFLSNCKNNGKLIYGLGVDNRPGIPRDERITKQRRDGKGEGFPVLYLGMSIQELTECLSKVDFSSEKITGFEAEVMKGFIESIGEQLQEVEDFKIMGKESSLHKTYAVLSQKVENLTAKNIYE